MKKLKNNIIMIISKKIKNKYNIIYYTYRYYFMKNN